jgi:hypothetical protein
MDVAFDPISLEAFLYTSFLKADLRRRDGSSCLEKDPTLPASQATGLGGPSEFSICTCKFSLGRPISMEMLHFGILNFDPETIWELTGAKRTLAPWG